jgi:hypothetical protein
MQDLLDMFLNATVYLLTSNRRETLIESINIFVWPLDTPTLLAPTALPPRQHKHSLASVTTLAICSPAEKGGYSIYLRCIPIQTGPLPSEALS